MIIFRGRRQIVCLDRVLIPCAIPQPEPDTAIVRIPPTLAGATCGWIHGVFPPVPPPPEIKQADRAKPGAHLSLHRTQCDSWLQAPTAG